MTDSKSNTVRLFFAITPSSDIAESISNTVIGLQKAMTFSNAKIAWVSSANYHVTLYFLGEVQTETAAQLKESLAESAKTVKPFQTDFRGVGFFPQHDKKPPRVLWAGVHNPPTELDHLRERCASSILKAGLTLPEQDFTPHVTIARIKSTRDLIILRKQVAEIKYSKFGVCTINELVLMQSITGNGPARYEPFARAPLGGER